MLHEHVKPYALTLNAIGDYQYTIALCEIDESKENDEFIPLGAMTLGSTMSKDEKIFISYAAYSLTIMLMLYIQTKLDLETLNELP